MPKTADAYIYSSDLCAGRNSSCRRTTSSDGCRRKAAVVAATLAGSFYPEEAGQRYMLSDEALAGSEAAFCMRGVSRFRCGDLHVYGGRGRRLRVWC